MSLSENFLVHFKELKDPRLLNRNFRHNLQDILTITILATICGADNWVEISNFGKSKKDWLAEFLELPHGIPSHDTFGRVFAALNANQFEKCFIQWVQSLKILLTETEGKKHIAIDGKTSRSSHNRNKNINPLHLVSAWSSDYNLLLGQVDRKSTRLNSSHT